MDAALVVITLLSLGLTGALVLYATRLQREAQQRSEARVAALGRELRRNDVRKPAAMARDDAAAPWPEDGGSGSGYVGRFRVQREGAGPRIDVDDFRAAAPAQSVAPHEERNVEPGARSGAAAHLFDAQAGDATRSHRLVALGLAAAALVFVAAVLSWSGGEGRGADGAGGSVPATPPAPGAPLELVLLRHDRAGSSLTISGVVRNPEGNAERKGITAVVFLFDRSGGFLTSGRADIDYQALAGGDESPFIVTIPDAGNAGRYRVSFRTGEAVVPHVDRRAPVQVADPEAARAG